MALACASCAPLEPYGEFTVVVDTDLPVPELAARLRVDVYKEDGSWLESRDFALPEPRDWPTSFGVYASYDDRESRALVRLRVFPEGRVRDYRGERFLPKPTFVEPFVADTFEELCPNAMELPLGHTILQRRGHLPILPKLLGSYDCDGVYSRTGSTSTWVDVPEAAAYTFAVLATQPAGYHASLELRRACDDPATAVDCASGVAPNGQPQQPVMTTNLEPGRYYLVTTGAVPSITGSGQGPSDLIIGAARADEWAALDLVPINASPEPPLPASPMWLRGLPEITPTLEPEPNVTVDRLLLLRFVPGEVGSTSVTLRGECMGTQADLSATPEARRAFLDLARTCVDREGSLAPIAEAPASSKEVAPTISMQRSFAFDEPCDDSQTQNDRVCVPGGYYLLGGRDAAGNGDQSSLPERLAKIPRFWIDRDEVSVARYRAALTQGLKILPKTLAPAANEGPLAYNTVFSTALCTWSQAPFHRETYPLNCISWYGARSFCQFYGGDLPTEAQWEYVAAAAWREHKTRYAWGDESPNCQMAVYGRAVLPNGSDECPLLPLGPQPFETYGADVTPGGVRGLAGGVAEWTLDSFQPYSSACWRASSRFPTICWDEHATERSYRGGHWAASSRGLASETRVYLAPTIPDPLHGFRCVHPGP